MRQTLKDGEHRWGATIDTPRELYYHASALVSKGAIGEACAARRKRRKRSASRQILNCRRRLQGFLLRPFGGARSIKLVMSSPANNPEVCVKVSGHPPSKGLRVLVAMPALNEERTVGDLIRRVPHDLSGVGVVETLVIDDGSTDRTVAMAREAGARVISHPEPLGLGTTFRTAVAYALENQFDILVGIDSDGQFDPATIPNLVAPVISGEADFASGSRFKGSAFAPGMPWINRWGNRMMSRLISRIAGQEFHDVSCGMRCYNRKALLHLNVLGSFTYAQEVFLNLAFKKLPIVEVPIPVRGEREHGRSRVVRSIPAYAIQTLKIILRCYRDYKPMRFFGWLALGLAIPALLLEGFVLVHYITTGALLPHKWAGFTGLGLMILSLAALHIGVIGDMLNRHRIYLEELLYEQRARGSRHGEER